jgi:F-type H+-transporting ATPase subunit c
MRRQKKNITKKRRKEMTADVMKMVTVGLIGGIGFFGPALALGLIGYSAMQSLGRNPEARGAIMTNMILIGALAEAIGIYVLIVCIILTMIVK